MENRIITVVSTKTQAKKQINTNATTLGELKAAMRTAGIDYKDMTFYEGVAKVELTDDASVLPHDVPYKGTTTNNLVIMLTNPDKKIKSGAMSRSEAYEYIRNNNLQAEVCARYGRNFTTVATENLVDFITERNQVVSTPERDTVKEVLTELIHTLYDYDILLESTHDDMINRLEGETSIYSDKEIEEMMQGR